MTRKIERSTEFKKDYKREKKGLHRATVEADLKTILAILVDDKTIPANYVDHPLKGNWRTFRDLHLYPDLVLIYKKVGDVKTGSLKLARLGSHSELF
ncbi:type II toxin-antitoxin system YafQ family toxin [Salmonella enterica subsp. enterica serovar Monschaui]|nr:type II toxin-antitoxin system YafQ family toxin [Salmonella enterica]EDV1680771.1 type II toxin-antitoxin system YafQ family toxin [Salmonella enterica subsp. enterica serovar Monschaui]EDX3322159.1 type II toxin-antitoxin system YafQ family toxin [Salmonella enterica subsp. enterica serovar Anatum]EJB7764824.1 type II toxin-antitoxin system YafQ family toxin [Salmonella enterica]